MDPLAREHLDVADRNPTISADLLHHFPHGLEQPAYEWVVIVCFYATVRCLNAYLYANNGAFPQSHSDRFRLIRQDRDLSSVVRDYSMLRSRSEQTRYTSSPASFDGYRAQVALDSARMVRERVRTLLHDN